MRTAWNALPMSIATKDVPLEFWSAIRLPPWSPRWSTTDAGSTTSPGFCRYYGPQYTATASVLYAHELGLVPITTPAYSPESNGLAEGFVHTFKRDYVNVHE